MGPINHCTIPRREILTWLCQSLDLSLSDVSQVRSRLLLLKNLQRNKAVHASDALDHYLQQAPAMITMDRMFVSILRVA